MIEEEPPPRESGRLDFIGSHSVVLRPVGALAARYPLPRHGRGPGELAVVQAGGNMVPHGHCRRGDFQALIQQENRPARIAWPHDSNLLQNLLSWVPSPTPSGPWWWLTLSLGTSTCDAVFPLLEDSSVC